MWAVIRRNPLAVVLAVILHVSLALILILGVDWEEKPALPKTNVNVVEAKVIDASRIDAEAQKLQQVEAKEKAQREAERRKEKERLEALKRKQAEEKKRLAKLEEQRKTREQQEAKRQAELKREREQLEKKRAAEQKRLAEAKAKREREEKLRKEAEAKRLAEEKKRKAAEEAKRQAEAKRKAEEQAKRKAAEEARRKAEAEARARAEQKAREDALRAQIAAEQEARERDRYVIAIKQQIERSWLRPPGTGESLECILQVRLIPGGDVVPGSVAVIRSSGNAAFDRSVETAVYKAAPLPVPGGGLFESFRDLRLNFKPNK